MDSRLLVIGSINMDLVVPLERHPRPGDTVLGGDAVTVPGGKGANQAAAAARAGGHVRMLGRVGNDAFGERLVASLRDAGVDTTLVATVDGSSGLALITVDAGGENMIVVSPGANARLTPDALSDDAFDGVDMVMMQLEIPLETVAEAARRARSRGVRVLLNPAPAAPLPDELVANVDVLVVNEGEAALLAGVEVTHEGEAEKAAARLLEGGAAVVVVTLGGRGVVWRSHDSSGRLAAHDVRVVDTTAAGDAFCGALATRLVEGAPLEDALRFANAAGALATTRHGAQSSLPDRREIEALLAAG